MKKIILFAILLTMLIVPGTWAANYYGCTGLIGGTAGALDALDITGATDPNADNLAEGDGATVSTISGTTVTSYYYIYDASGTAAESSPSVIRPDDYATSGNWILSQLYTTNFTATGVATISGSIELGHASDTTIARSGAGAITVEGAVVSLLGTTIGAAEVDADVATQAELDAVAALVDTDDEIIAIINTSPSTQISVPAGGIGVGTLTDGGVLLGSGTGAITPMGVLADGEFVVGDGTTDPVAESGATVRASLGLTIGTDVQGFDADLTTYANITPSADVQTLLGTANEAAMRTFLDLEAGTDFYSVSGADTAFEAAVTEGTLTDSVIVSADIKDGEVTEADLNASNTPGAGEDNYILSYNHAGTNFTWVAAGAGSGDLLADGSVPLTANWDVGAYTITGTQFISDIAIGTAPFVVTSTDVVTNLNADLLDGENATAFEDADAAIVKSDEAETITANWVNTANPWAVNEGGTGAATFTDGGVLLGSGTGAVTAMAVLTDGQIIVGDGTTDPVAESGATARTSLGLAIGTDVLAPDGDGSSLTSVDAATGDSATAFFDAGEIEDARIPNDITIDLATLATTLTISDNADTNENNAILFTSGGDLDGGNIGIESEADFYFNPSTNVLHAGGGFSSDGVATPEMELNDSDAAGADAADEYAGSLYANMTTTTEDAEVSDVLVYFQDAGSKKAAITIDGSEDTVIFGTDAIRLTALAAPTTDADGDIALDADGWGTGYDAIEYFNGNASAYLVATTAADTPTDGQVPKWNTGGTITWEDDSTGSGSLGTNLTSTSNDITTDNNVIQLVGNSEDVDIEFGANSIDITTDTGVTEIDFIGITLKDDGATIITSAANTIDSDQYVDGSIDNEHLADDAVGTAEIATDAVTMDSIDADGNFTSLTGNIATTGTIHGAIKIVTTTDGTESPTAADMYGSIYVADHATAANDTDYTLPTAVAGMNACFYDFGAGDGGVIIDAAASDVIWFDGTALTAANALDSPGVAGAGPDGDFVCMVALDATNWVVTGWSGTWVDGGAD